MTKKRPTTSDQGNRAEHLVVVRESDLYDRVLMQGMIDQTLAACSPLPGVARLKRLGVELLDRYQEVGAQLVRKGKSSAVWGEVDGTVFVYSMGSAASDDLEGDNAFVEILREVVESVRPLHVWTGTFSRLVRATEFGGALFGSLKKHSRYVHVSDGPPIDLHAPIGQATWTMLSLVAAMERDWIVQRLVAGLISMFRRGEWILSPNHVPPGFRLNADNQLEIDPDRVDLVRSMLEVLADESLTDRQACERLGELGLSSPTIRQHHGPESTYADVKHPGHALAALVGWRDLYEQGRYVVERQNAFTGVDQIAGIPVHRDDPADPHGYLKLALTAPQPEGGWAEPSVFNAIAKRTARTAKRNRGGTAHRRVKALTGIFEWTGDGYEYKVFSRHDRYMLYRRPATDHPAGWFDSHHSISGEHLASIRASELHESIAHTAAHTFSDGVPVELTETPIWVEGARTLTLGGSAHREAATRRRLEEAEASAKRARRNANLADDDDLADAFIAEARDFTDEARRLRSDLDELQAHTDQPALGDEFESNAGFIVGVLAKLAHVEGALDSETRQALKWLIQDARLQPCEEGVRWSVKIMLPTPDGAALAGPVEGIVPNRKKNLKPSPISVLGLNTRANSVLSVAPPGIVEAIRVGDPASDWARHVRSVYQSDDFAWKAGMWQLPDQGRQRLVDEVAAAGGRIPIHRLRDTGIPSRHIQRYSRAEDFLNGAPVATRHGPWGKGPTREGEQREVGLVDCPHCPGNATTVIIVPEVPTNLLCPDCRRMPIEDSPQFPEWYISPVPTSQTQVANPMKASDHGDER